MGGRVVSGGGSIVRVEAEIGAWRGCGIRIVGGGGIGVSVRFSVGIGFGAKCGVRVVGGGGRSRAT